MARTDNLTNFLIDIGSAVRTKTNTVNLIPVSKMDTMLESLPKVTSKFVGFRQPVNLSSYFCRPILGNDNNLYFGTSSYNNGQDSNRITKLDTKTLEVSAIKGGTGDLSIGTIYNGLSVDNYIYFNGTSFETSKLVRLDILTQTIDLIPVPFDSSWSPSIIVDNYIYFIGTSNIEFIKRFNITTQIGTKITVPKDTWVSPILAKDGNIYYGGHSGNTLSTPTIGKFNPITEIGTRIIVPSESGVTSSIVWQLVGIAKDDCIYFVAGKKLLRFDVDTQSGTLIDLSQIIGVGLGSNMSVIGSDGNIYFGLNNTTNMTEIGKFDIDTQIFSKIIVPSGLWYTPNVLGHYIFFGNHIGGTGTIEELGLFDIYTQTGVKISVPRSSGWCFPISTGDGNIYFGRRTNDYGSNSYIEVLKMLKFKI